MRYLVAFDGSREAENALAYATDIADAMEGSITVAYAVDPDVYDAGGSQPISDLSDADQRLFTENIEDAEERGLERLEEGKALAAEFGYDVETELLYGDPVEEITDYAESEGFDGVFVGHRGRSEHVERLLGSVSEGIVERATVPVTVVR